MIDTLRLESALAQAERRVDELLAQVYELSQLMQQQAIADVQPSTARVRFSPPDDYDSPGINGPTGLEGINPSLGAVIGHTYSFEAWATSDADTTLNMIAGDVWLGPDTVIHWGDISGASTTPSVSSTNTCVWLEIDLSAATPTAIMYTGTRADMEEGPDDDTTLVVPLVETTWTDGAISAVKNLHCGDVCISRAN